MKGLLARNESGLLVGTECAAQNIVEEVFGEHCQFYRRGLPEGFRTFFLREFNYGKPLEAVNHDSNSVDICCGG